MERIQIAGIHDLDEARLCLRAGVRQLGFPHALDVHPEDCSIAETGEICRSLPRKVEKVLITYLDCADSIIALCRETGVGMVQLHGDIDVREAARLRGMAPDLGIIKSLVVRECCRASLMAAMFLWTPLVEAFITDTFDPVSGASGATGKTHDWGVSRLLVDHAKKPVILAGGLNPENVVSAIRLVRPWGVDCHTGVEGRDGRKDFALVKAFVLKAKESFEALER